MLERNLGEHRQENIVGASDDETILDDVHLLLSVRSKLIPRHSVAIRWSTDRAQESYRFHVRHCSETKRVNEATSRSSLERTAHRSSRTSQIPAVAIASARPDSIC